MQRWLRRMLERRAQPLPDSVRRAFLAAAFLSLVSATAWAWHRSELQTSDVSWGPVIALALVAAPLSLLLKAAEFSLASRIAGQRPGAGSALETAVVSSAANLLPIPGSIIVTVQTIASSGATYGGAISASAVPGVAWLGFTGLIGGAAVAASGPVGLGVAIMAVGLVAIVAAAMMFRTIAPADGRAGLSVAIIVVELSWLAVSGLRFTLAAAALGVDLDTSQALALSVAGAVTVAIGFVPGGLGVREAIIAGLSPLIGLDVETGVLLGAIDRVVWLGFLGVAGGALAARQRNAASSSSSASS